MLLLALVNALDHPLSLVNTIVKILLWLDFNTVIINWGSHVNTANVVFPIAYSQYYSVTFGIIWNKPQYGYDAIKTKLLTGFTMADIASGLGQMYIAIGF